MKKKILLFKMVENLKQTADRRLSADQKSNELSCEGGADTTGPFGFTVQELTDFCS